MLVYGDENFSFKLWRIYFTHFRLNLFPPYLRIIILIFSTSRVFTTSSIKTEHANNNDQIPRDGLFSYVSCPRYLAQIIIRKDVDHLLHIDYQKIFQVANACSVLYVKKNEQPALRRHLGRAPLHSSPHRDCNITHSVYNIPYIGCNRSHTLFRAYHDRQLWKVKPFKTLMDKVPC